MSGADREAGLRFYGMVGAVILLWGLHFVFIKMAYRGMGPFTLVWIRSLFSGLVLLLWNALRGGPVRLPARRPAFWGNALLMIGFLVFFHVGLLHTTASRSALFLYAYPVFTTLLAALFLGERMGARAAAGLAAAAAGVCLLFGDRIGAQGRDTLLGDALTLLSAAVWAWQGILVRTRLREMDLCQIIGWALVLGAPVLIAAAGWRGQLVPYDLWRWDVAAGVLYSVFVGTALAMVLWFSLVSTYHVGRVSAFMFLTPVVGVVSGWAVLGDRLGPVALAGAALVALGIFLVNAAARA